MTTKTASNPQIRQRVLSTLAANRHHRVHFPGAFMALQGRQESEDHVVLEFDDGAWCRDTRGEVALTPFGVLLDTALGAVTRLHAGATRQHATVHIEAHFTGEPTTGHLAAHSHFMGFSTRTALPHGMSRATVSADGRPVVHASGSFVILDLPPGASQRPPAWMRDAIETPAEIDTATLEGHEREVLEACDRAQASASAQHAFVDEFWGGTPEAQPGAARLAVPVSAHLGNRVGNVHGGILFGLAARVANAALPGSMRLSNLSAWFVSPGQGARLDVRSSVVQQGRSLAVVRTEILSDAGKRVLEATSQHVATQGA